jgi:hypothetical protein
MENWLDCERMVSKCSVSCTKLRRKLVPVGQPVLGGLRDICPRLPSTRAERICFTEKSYNDDPSIVNMMKRCWAYYVTLPN